MRKMFMCLLIVLTLAIQAQIAFGACCLPTGGCADYSQATCELEIFGLYVPGSCTEPGICQLDGRADLPTMNQWGMIVFMMLAGGGAVYFMRKQGKTTR